MAINESTFGASSKWYLAKNLSASRGYAQATGEFNYSALTKPSAVKYIRTAYFNSATLGIDYGSTYSYTSAQATVVNNFTGSLADGALANKLAYTLNTMSDVADNNSIDTSICFGGLGADSGFNHVRFFSRTNSGAQGTEQFIDYETIGVNEPQVNTPFFLAQRASNSTLDTAAIGNTNAGLFALQTAPYTTQTDESGVTSYQAVYNNCVSATQYSGSNSTSALNASEYGLIPITDFDYENTVFLIIVKATSTVESLSGTPTRMFTLKAYVEGGHETYPYVTGVFIVPFAYSNSDTVRNYLPTSVLPCIMKTYVGAYSTANSFNPQGNDTQAHNFGWMRFKSLSLGHVTSTIGFYYDDTNSTSSQWCGLTIAGLASTGGQNYIAVANNTTLPIIGGTFTFMSDGDTQYLWRTAKPSATVNNTIFYMNPSDLGGIDSFDRWVKSQASHFGMYFTDDYETARTGNKDSERMFLAVTSNGVGVGSYTQGDGNQNNDRYTITDPWQPGYTPDSVPDSGGGDPFAPVLPPDSTTPLNLTPVNSTSGAFTRTYIVTLPELRQLANWLYTDIAADTPDVTLQKFGSYNAVDCICSVISYPFNVYNAMASQSASQSIVIGNQDTQISGYALNGSLLGISLGAVNVVPLFGADDFRSYAPYTSLSLSIPYCGSCELSCSDFMGNTLSVYMLIDINTGACNALVSCNGAIVQSLAGQIGMQIPVSGLQQADLASSIFNAQQSFKQSSNLLDLAEYVNLNVVPVKRASNAVQAVTGNGADVLGMLSDRASSQEYRAAQETQLINAEINLDTEYFNLTHIKHAIRQIGHTDSMTAAGTEQKCRLYYTTCVMPSTYNASQYGHNVGFACYRNEANLNAYSGFTVCSSFDTTSIPCTAKEKEMIAEAMLSGSYL